MTFESWQTKAAKKAKRDNERRELENTFNAQIISRHHAGQTKEQIIADLRITSTLFHRIVGYGLMAAD